jgi:hypothetical protein
VHLEVAEIRRTSPILRVDLAGFKSFRVLTRYADVFDVSRESSRRISTSRPGRPSGLSHPLCPE